MKNKKYIIFLFILVVIIPTAFIVYGAYSSSHKLHREFKFFGDTLDTNSKAEKKASDSIFKALKNKVDREKNR